MLSFVLEYLCIYNNYVGFLVVQIIRSYAMKPNCLLIMIYRYLIWNIYE